MLPGPGRRNTDHGVCMIGSADENRIVILVPDDFPVIMVDRYSVERFPILFGIIIIDQRLSIRGPPGIQIADGNDLCIIILPYTGQIMNTGNAAVTNSANINPVAGSIFA